jgi:hypothetical protein
MPRESPDIPPKMQKVLRRFERWRSAHTGRLPIPQRLWTAAACGGTGQPTGGMDALELPPNAATDCCRLSISAKHRS